MARVLRRQRGFTLIELMYAMGYFMIGLAGLVCFQALGASGASRAADVSTATSLTSSTLEVLRSASATSVLAATPMTSTYDRWGNLTSASAFYTVSPAVTGTANYFTVTATCAQSAGNPYYEAIVNTTWTDSGSVFPHTVSLRTYIPAE